MKPWDQQEDESKQAYTAFLAYRNLPMDTRSLRTACGVVYGGSTANVRRLEQWSSKFRWVERVAVWDNEQQRIRDEATTKAIAKVTEKAAAKQEISAQKILAEQANLAFSRIHRIAPWRNVPGLVDSDKLSDEDLATIKSIEIKTDQEGNKTVKLQLWDKQPALAKLGENKKLWGNREEASSQTFFSIFLEGLRSGELEAEIERRKALDEQEANTIEVRKVDE